MNIAFIVAVYTNQINSRLEQSIGDLVLYR